MLSAAPATGPVKRGAAAAAPPSCRAPSGVGTDIKGGGAADAADAAEAAAASAPAAASDREEEAEGERKLVPLSTLRALEQRLADMGRRGDELVVRVSMWKETAQRSGAEAAQLRGVVARVQGERSEERARLTRRIEQGRKLTRALERRILALSRRGVGIGREDGSKRGAMW